MNVGTVKSAVAKSGTRPVIIKLTGGRQLNVPHPEWAQFSSRPSATEFLVDLPGGGIEVVSFDEVASIELAKRTPKKAA